MDRRNFVTAIAALLGAAVTSSNASDALARGLRGVCGAGYGSYSRSPTHSPSCFHRVFSAGPFWVVPVGLAVVGSCLTPIVCDREGDKDIGRRTATRWKSRCSR